MKLKEELFLNFKLRFRVILSIRIIIILVMIKANDGVMSG